MNVRHIKTLVIVIVVLLAAPFSLQASIFETISSGTFELGSSIFTMKQ